jgi:hypothetical protein
MGCNHDKGTECRRDQLRAKHGTPSQFAEACNRSADGLEITTAECGAAIQKYWAEWGAAGPHVGLHFAGFSDVW